MKSTKMDDRILLMNVSVETNSKGTTATPDFLWQITEAYNVHFPQAVGDKKSLYKYHPTYSSGKISLPFNIAVDLRTMKITHAQKGTATVSSVESAGKTVLGSP